MNARTPEEIAKSLAKKFIGYQLPKFKDLKLAESGYYLSDNGEVIYEIICSQLPKEVCTVKQYEEACKEIGVLFPGCVWGERYHLNYESRVKLQNLVHSLGRKIRIRFNADRYFAIGEDRNWGYDELSQIEDQFTTFTVLDEGLRPSRKSDTKQEPEIKLVADQGVMYLHESKWVHAKVLFVGKEVVLLDLYNSEVKLESRFVLVEQREKIKHYDTDKLIALRKIVGNVSVDQFIAIENLYDSNNKV